MIECFTIDDEPTPPTPVRRKSIQRQEAFFGEPTGNSLENMSDAAPSEPVSDGTSDGALSEGHTVTIPGLVVRDIYLQVPDLKRDRAASVDSCFSKVQFHTSYLLLTIVDVSTVNKRTFLTNITQVSY